MAFFPRQNSAHALHQPASILHAGDVFGVDPRDLPHVLAPGLEVILAQAPAHHLRRDALVRGELDQLAGDFNGRGRREASRRPSPPARLPLCPRACGALPGAPLRRDGFLAMTERRFPPPWSVDDPEGGAERRLGCPTIARGKRIPPLNLGNSCVAAKRGNRQTRRASLWLRACRLARLSCFISTSFICSASPTLAHNRCM